MTEVNIAIENIEPLKEGRASKLVKVVGELDETNVDEKMQEIYTVIGENPWNLDLIMDFSGLGYLNSKTIGYLTDIYGKLAETNGKIAIFSARPNVFDTLQVVGLTQLINMYDSFELAKAGIVQELKAPEVNQTEVPTNQPEQQMTNSPSVPPTTTAAQTTPPTEVLQVTPAQTTPVPAQEIQTTPPQTNAPSPIAPIIPSQPNINDAPPSMPIETTTELPVTTVANTASIPSAPTTNATPEISAPSIGTPMAEVLPPTQTQPSTPIINPTPVNPEPQTKQPEDMGQITQTPNPVNSETSKETPTQIQNTDLNTNTEQKPINSEENTYKFEG